MPKTIHSLPPEILGEIFLLASRASRPVQAFAATKLAAVCSQWRLIAISYPDLWCYIHVVTMLRYPPLPTLTLWIHRSAPKLLQVHIEVIDYTFGLPLGLPRRLKRDQYLIAVIDKLAPTCSRWASLELPLYDSLEAFQGLRFDLAKGLRKLIAPTSAQFSSNESHDAFLTSLFTTPLLTCLKLHCRPRENLLRLAPAFSWNSLITLDLSCDSPCELIAQTILECTSITYLSIRIMQPVCNINMFPRNIVLPSLRILQIVYESTDAFALFSSLECLELHGLDIDPGWHPYPIAPAVLESQLGLLASFLDRGKHQIQMFRLSVGAIPRLDECITDVLLSCRRAGIPWVELCITDPWKHPYNLTDWLEAIAEVLDNVPTTLPPFLVVPHPRANLVLVGWFDDSRVTLHPSDQWPSEYLNRKW